MELIISLIERTQSHYSLVLLIVFLLTFSKSCALISFVIPGTSGLLVLGALASTSIGHFLLMWLSASLAQSADSGSHGKLAVAISIICSVCAGSAPNACCVASYSCAVTAVGRCSSAVFCRRCEQRYR